MNEDYVDFILSRYAIDRDMLTAPWPNEPYGEHMLIMDYTTGQLVHPNKMRFRVVMDEYLARRAFA